MMIRIKGSWARKRGRDEQTADVQAGAGPAEAQTVAGTGTARS